MTFKAHGKQNDWLTEGRQKKTKKEWARVMTELSLFIVGKQTCCKGYTTSSNTQEWKQMDEYRSSLLNLCSTLTLSGPN